MDEMQELPSVDEIQKRLGVIFPEAFPDRTILVGQMAARVLFVFLYGGAIGESGNLLRPSHIYLFTSAQALKVRREERAQWIEKSIKPGYRAEGQRWYADNSRESIRDDLMRNQYGRIGIIKKKMDAGHSTTSSKPIYYLDSSFASLLDPTLPYAQFEGLAETWRSKNLDTAALQRMVLKAQNENNADHLIHVNLPDGQRIKMSSGLSNRMVKSLVECFAVKHLNDPMVLWISASDKKSHPYFKELAASIGLKFDLNAELPDVILVDLDEPLRFIFCEIVATDGAITEKRKEDLLSIASKSHISESVLDFLTVFEDRNSAPFRKNFSQIAVNSRIWFQTEPDIIILVKSMKALG